MNDPKGPAGGGIGGGGGVGGGSGAAGAGAGAGTKRTLVEDGTKFKGSLTSTCPILVQGSIEGDVEGPSLTVSATGAVSGKIVTGTLKSDGKIAGEFDVDTAQLAGSVANSTIVHATSLDLKLSVPTGKLELKFGPGTGRGRS